MVIIFVSDGLGAIVPHEIDRHLERSSDTQSENHRLLPANWPSTIRLAYNAAVGWAKHH